MMVVQSADNLEQYRKYEPIFGAWYFKSLIGTGSYGRVFVIERTEFDKTYRSALKIISIPQDESETRRLKAGGSDDQSIISYYDDLMRTLADECAIMADFKGNSNIVSYEDHKIVPHDSGIGYDILIRMELLTPLIEHITSSPLDESEVIRLGHNMCDALSLCHCRGILHRDVKPDNIFLSETGNYKLGDFGIAKVMEDERNDLSRKGSYNYMAPEVYRGEAYGEQADIYSLGLVLYYLTNGNRPPFYPPAPEQIMPETKEQALASRMQGETILPPAYASEGLSEIILKACAHEPEDRFASAAEMARALRNLVDLDTTLPLSQATTERTEKPGETEKAGKAEKKPGRSKALLLIPLILIAVMICAGYAMYSNKTASPEPDSLNLLAADWDWDSSRTTGSSMTVDVIFNVKNTSDVPITGMDFTVATQSGGSLQNTGDGSDSFRAEGYVRPGDKGVMWAEVYTDIEKFSAPVEDIEVKSLIVSRSLPEDYRIPEGRFVEIHGENDEYYDVEINNPNDIPVSSKSTVVAVWINDDDSIEESDATGRLNGPVKAGDVFSKDFNSFNDPNLYGYDNLENYSIYVIDTETYHEYK